MTSPPRRRPRRGLLLCVATAIAVVVTLWLVGTRWAIPAAIDAGARRALARHLPEARYRVVSVDARRLRLADVQVGPALAVAEVEVRYTLVDLLRGRVGTVALRGARARIDLDERSATPWQIAPSDLAELPFEELEVIDAALAVERRGRAWQVPLRGRLTATGAGARLVAHAHVAGAPVAIGGELRVATDVASLRLSARAEGWAAADELSLAVDLPEPADEAAAVRFTATLRRAHAETVIDGRPVAVSGLVADLAGAIGGESPTALALRARAASAVAGDRELGPIALDADGDGELLRYHLEAQVEGWERVAIRGALPVAPGRFRLDEPHAISWEAEGDGAAPLAAALASTGARVAPGGTLHASGAAWVGLADGQVKVDDARVRAELDSIEIAGGGVTLAGVRTELRLDAIADAGGVRATLRDGHLDARAATIGGGDEAVRAQRLRLAVTPAPDRPLFEQDGAGAIRVAARLRAVERVRVRAPALGWLRRLELDLHAERGPKGGGAGRLDLLVRVGAGDLAHEGSALDLSGLSMTLPVSYDAAGLSGRGRARVADVRLRGQSLGPVTGQLRLRGASVAFEGRCALTERASLAVAASVAAGPRGTRAALELSLPASRIRRGDRAERVAAALLGARVAGTATFALSLASTGGQRSERLEVSLAGGAVVDGSRSLSGVDAALAFDRLTPLRPAGAQRIRWREGAMGDRAFGAGVVELRGEPDGALVFDRAEVAIAGGRLLAAGARVAPDRSAVSGELVVEGVELSRALAALTDGRAGGEGKLHGTLPLQLRLGARPQLRFGHGALAARGGGTLRVQDTGALAGLLARDAGGYGEVVRERVVSAMTDFLYSRLDLEVLPATGRPTLRVRTRGRGRRVPQEIDLTVNINHFQSLVDPALALLLRVDPRAPSPKGAREP